MSFESSDLTFDEGIRRILSAFKKANAHEPEDIVTSRSKDILKVAALLGSSSPVNGFKKWQLPVFMDGPSQFFVSVGAADTVVPIHSHDEGDGIRVIMSGSIIYKGIELTEGDWMFIPKGRKYDFQVGARGVTQFYCYQCCCVPK